MKINRLEMTYVRAFEQAELDFNPSMNLLVGVNGVGKTTVLDAIRICLSKILPDVTASRSRPVALTQDDIRVAASALTIRLSIDVVKHSFQFLVHKQREATVPHKAGEVRQQTLDTPDQETCSPDLSTLSPTTKTASAQPLGVFFSTRRSLVSDGSPASGLAAGGQAAAFAEALSSRELRLSELAYWMRAQDSLATESPQAKRHLAALRRASKAFLPACKNLRPDNSPRPRLVVDKAGMMLDVRQLSDGERSILSIVLDLARRLSQANPGLSDPVRQGRAVVLIDEIDLHLHPKWQRTVVECLTTTFPQCQFIVTTHSPQIVAAVQPEQVLLLSEQRVWHPDRSLGMDSNWILRHLMESDDRPEGAADSIREVDVLIKKGDFKNARRAIEKGKSKGFDIPEWSVLESRMARLEILSK